MNKQTQINTQIISHDKSDDLINEKERLKTLEIMFGMFPELKKNRDEILLNILEKFGKPIKYILTQTIIDGEILYMDDDGMFFDKNLKLIGFLHNNIFFRIDVNKDENDKIYEKITTEYSQIKIK